MLAVLHFYFYFTLFVFNIITHIYSNFIRLRHLNVYLRFIFTFISFAFDKNFD